MTSSSDTARQYARTHAGRFRHELHGPLRIPGLSGDPAHAGPCRRRPACGGLAGRAPARIGRTERPGHAHRRSSGRLRRVVRRWGRSVRLLATGEPALIDVNIPEMQAAARLREGMGRPAGLYARRRQHPDHRGDLQPDA